ncbi:histone-lysine N-methyltransferase SETMAR-like [Bombus pyrosoma]|uniref:histone-lysine N-methyltransferase SETMAR-like n=1 Tax=Bombus pyrosoma TaxID=396416 RepID=UPI001CB8CB49|nr:histone-lysine N-methyltransferase SETMAR-like [Bombus pyrosoma]
MEEQDANFRHILLYYFRKVKNAQRSGRPVEVDETHIKDIIDSDRHSTTCEIAENVSRTCMKKKLKQLGYVKKLDLWLMALA